MEANSGEQTDVSLQKREAEAWFSVERQGAHQDFMSDENSDPILHLHVDFHLLSLLSQVPIMGKAGDT